MKQYRFITLFLTAGLLILFFQCGKKGDSVNQHSRHHKPNHLINEKSPYLQQHAYNPVDWYPWGEDAFRKAKKENKLILLSIGYSACHWCHVMAHESFENDSIAAYMNAHFVNIKVDREEHPDVDQLYQTFVQMSTGRGGWPLTVFLTPDLVPVYGGTYFPAQPRYGMISFPDLLRRISELYQSDPDKIARSSRDIRKMLREFQQVSPGRQLPDADASFENLFTDLQKLFDSREGGFSGAPKFPHVSDMRFLLSYYHHTGAAPARDMTLFTLRKMAEGGIYDQIGGGFHRYSTDANWLVPHFEKMLYDNALLIPLYVDAYRLTGDDFYLTVARGTADFVLRELTDPNGGFYATLDADSEGEEGKYYVWDYAELRDRLPEDIRELFCEYYGVTPGGNFEGKNILHVTRALGELAQKSRFSEQELAGKFREARQILFQAREKRVRPNLDNKILTDWNGMMISALYRLYQVTGDSRYRMAAGNARNFILQHYYQPDGRLVHFRKSDREAIAGNLDDYAYLIRALLDGFETEQNPDFLAVSQGLARYVLRHFRDATGAGFFFNEAGENNLIARLRQDYDSSTPAGSGIMAIDLVRLNAYSGQDEYLRVAEDFFKAYRKNIRTRGQGMATLVRAFALYHYGLLEITLAGRQKSRLDSLQRDIFRLFLPDRVLLVLTGAETPAGINPGLVEGRRIPQGEAAFICYQRACSFPQQDAAGIRKTILDFGLHLN